MLCVGDIALAEPGATVAFAGKRVIEGTVKEALPIGFQTSEYLRDKGQVDLVVERKDIAKTHDFVIYIIKKEKSTIIENEDNESSKLTIQTQQAS